MFWNRLNESISATEVRKAGVWVGHVACWLCAVSACAYSVLYGSTFTVFITTLAACTVCQMFAIAAALWPGDGARSRDVLDCLNGTALDSIVLYYFAILAAFLLVLVLAFTGYEIPEEVFTTVAMGVPAHLAANIMSLIAVWFLVFRPEERKSRKRFGAIPDSPDWSDSGGWGCGAD
ncbi:hypothetical protein [Streptomyces sp. NBC_00690]|uniref:hypothetical protein n=1 Tax=Streptomyces sp. NBC_00690 TaxID=2975808 RepID=UPI002E27AA81|nr:hypothetical protein [Streptomyces sp. NBC_00690]